MAYGYRIKAADGKIVANLPTHCPLTRENPANALLVAAAPDLLAVCKMALEELDDRPGVHNHVKEILREAIVKATGQAVKG